MKLLSTSVAVCLGVACLTTLADSPTEPFPWVTTSSRGGYLFKMVPAITTEKDGEWVTQREASGVAYHVDEKGEFREIWTSTGWYTFKGYLSDDGRYFVRFGPWASDQENHTDLAIAFYDRGKLVKEYQVKELIQEPDLLEDSVSHYFWQPAVQTDPTGFRSESFLGEETFRLTMIDKTTYDFDFKTGRIVTRGRDAGAKSRSEIRADEMAAEAKKGRDLFESSGFREAFLNEFEISDITASSGSYTSTSLAGQSWEAILIPKKKLDYSASVKPLFPITKDGRVEVTLTPQEIVSVIEGALDHPYVKQRLEHGGATGVRLRILGDRLHWNSTEITGFLEDLTGRRPTEDEVKHWAYFIIDADEPRYTSLYFNAKGGQVIASDDPARPWVPFFIDAAGKRVARSQR